MKQVMKYLKSYNIFESVNINDINELFFNISDSVDYNVTCKRVSKDYVKSFLDSCSVYSNGSYNSLNVDFNESDYNNDRFLINIKSIRRLSSRKPSTSVELIQSSTLYDDLKFADDYLKSELGLKIRIVEVYHVVKLPKQYSSPTAEAHSKITDNKILLDSGYKREIIEQVGNIIDKLKSFDNIKRINIVIF